ncbi:unnamed protein product [Cylicocyclus nassatus]|uniref:DNA repair metallo-beta-lactamase domain-containing protein n=1 Tax=Cylicocyclus nassatus TaxID=53992 RepID=A0AA36M8C8_CYLNA|nr:unnamed protein product [Cylicocyclus nassatus]
MVILRSGRTYTATADELLVSTEDDSDGSREIASTSEKQTSNVKRTYGAESEGIGTVEGSDNCKRVKVNVAELEGSSQSENKPSRCEKFSGEENLAQVLARCAQEETKSEETIVPMVEAQESLPNLQMELPLPVMARKNEEREGGGLVIGQNIAVDRFYINDKCEYHFLTHAHVLINKKFIDWGAKPIYCSQLTARLLPLVLPGKASLSKIIRPLEVGKVHSIDPTLHVTLLDANHCPGSVMFLFEGSFVPGGSALVTGHFRADSQFMALFDNDPAFTRLSQTFLSTVYLDATCFDESLGSLPERKDSEKMLVDELRKNQGRTIIIPIPKVGMEDILAGISQKLAESVLVSSQTLSVSKLCGVKGGKLVANGNDANFRIRTLSVTNMWSRCFNAANALKKAPKPAMIVDLSPRGDLRRVLGESILWIPYSSHSSNREIHEFLARLKYGNVVCTDKLPSNRMLNTIRKAIRKTETQRQGKKKGHTSRRSSRRPRTTTFRPAGDQTVRINKDSAYFLADPTFFSDTISASAAPSRFPTKERRGKKPPIWKKYLTKGKKSHANKTPQEWKKEEVEEEFTRQEMDPSALAGYGQSTSSGNGESSSSTTSIYNRAPTLSRPNPSTNSACNQRQQMVEVKSEEKPSVAKLSVQSSLEYKPISALASSRPSCSTPVHLA